MVNQTHLKCQMLVETPMVGYLQIIVLELIIADGICRCIRINKLPCHPIGCDMVAITHFCLEITFMKVVISKDKRQAEIETMLSHTISALELQTEQKVVVESILRSQVELIYQSLAFRVAHIERIKDRTQLEIALIFLTEILRNTVQHIIAYHIPKHIFYKIIFLMS